MAGDMTVRGGWHTKDARGREVGHHVLPTMADTGEIDVRTFFRTVYRRKWILILSMAASMGGTTYWMLQITPIYSADVLVLVEPRESSIVNVDGRSISTDTAVVNTEVAVLESRGLAAKVIRKLGLEEDPDFAPATPADETEPTAASSPASAGSSHALASTDSRIGEGALHDGAAFVKEGLKSLWSALRTGLREAQSVLASARAGSDHDKQQRADGTEAEERDGRATRETVEARKAATLLDRFLSRLTVQQEGQSRLIRITFESTDPVKAAMITNKLVDEYMANQLETKSEGARRAAEWLEARLAELGGTVRALQDKVQSQRQESGSNRRDAVAQRLAQLNTLLVVARTDAVSAGARYEQVRKVVQHRGNLDALPAVVASSSIQELRSIRANLTTSLSELETSYGPQHPQIISLQAEIHEVDQAVKREIDNTMVWLRNEVERAEIHAARLERDLEEVGQEMTRLDEAEAAITQVAQELQANQDLYGNLLKRYTEAMALRDNQQPDARVISPAQIPLTPSHPNFPRIMALSFVGSASLAAFLLVLAERLRQKLYAVEDVEREVGLQVIGVIPDLPRLHRVGAAPRDYVQREPLSEFGGAFQRLRALLTLSNNRVMPRTVLVTSCTSGEGKTTIAVCLGIASISSGQKVLLVDCDFARPQVHRMLDVDNEVGLTDILKGTATVQEAITRAVGSSLSILTVGRSPDGAIDLLNSARMEALLAELKASFDIIILDSAPVQVSNALILGGLADKTIFVTRREWTTRRKARYSLKQLQLYGADVAGVVFNRAATVGSYAA
jgi:capsular exopolysaccharide synthesis family protein